MNTTLVANYREFDIVDLGLGYLLVAEEGDDGDYVQMPFCCVDAAKAAIDLYQDFGVDFHEQPRGVA